MATLEASIDRVAAETRFSGVVRVDRGDGTAFAAAYGLACRRCGEPNRVSTRFGIASGTKALTALTVVRLIESGRLELTTPARTLLGDDLPLIGADVTVEHLLAHRSGIGDYLDEDGGWAVTDHVLPVPVHTLATTVDYLAVLDGWETRFPVGERFAYCNSGYVVLALLAERAGGLAFADLVRREVCEPAGMEDAAFLRSDELPAGTASGYLDAEGLRTNVLHLPVLGVGDGGLYATVADIHALWAALFGDRIVAPRWRRELLRPRSEETGESMRYGMGFWLAPTGDGVAIEGYDPGISFHSSHDPATTTTWTVVSNTSEGAWPVARLLRETLDA
jgi:CubicO group peptidase (beta-lactamase class C family)